MHIKKQTLSPHTIRSVFALIVDVLVVGARAGHGRSNDGIRFLVLVPLKILVAWRRSLLVAVALIITPLFPTTAAAATFRGLLRCWWLHLWLLLLFAATLLTFTAALLTCFMF